MICRHGTTVAFGQSAVFLRGASGVGKSDLALRLIEAGGQLVADDQTQLRSTVDGVMASPPPVIAGNLEVRGLGILCLPYCQSACLKLIIDLTSEPLERIAQIRYEDILGHLLPVLCLRPFEISVVAKIRQGVIALEQGQWPDKSPMPD